MSHGSENGDSSASQGPASRQASESTEPEYRECVICLEQFDAEKVFTLPCGCIYDIECIKELFRLACSDISAFPPTCHGRPLRLDDYVMQLGTTIIIEYLEMQNRYNSPHKIYCATPTCSAALWLEETVTDGERAYRICSRCQRATCAKCRISMDEHDSTDQSVCPAPSEGDRALRRLCDEMDWQICPQCRTAVEKVSGCDEIACKCGCKFCYRCGGTLEGDFGCSCRQWQ